MDNLDLEILNILKKDARLSNKQIGEMVHMTGQAVGVRINKLIEDGVIKNFTVNLNKEKLGLPITALIKVYMSSNEHSGIRKLIDSAPEITEAYRISADGCYFLKVETDSNEKLNQLLDGITRYANYQLSIAIAELK